MRGEPVLVPLFLPLLLLLLLGPSLLVRGQEASIEQRYTWTYAGRSWALIHRFSAAHYGFYRTRPRVLGYTRYDEYVHDEHDDKELQSLVDALERLAADAGLVRWETLNLVITFVQSIPYVGEAGEYPRYPLETLVERKADCEDAAILAAALLRQMRFDVVLLAFVEQNHMALGIHVVPPASVTDPPYLWNGNAYYYLEPTSLGWAIGDVPERYRSQPEIVPLRPILAPSRR